MGPNPTGGVALYEEIRTQTEDAVRRQLSERGKEKRPQKHQPC